MKELMNQMVEYIAYADSAISDLTQTPKFSDSALTKSAASLRGAGLIKESEEKELVELFRQNPDKALASITKLATMLSKESRAIPSLGGPSDLGDINRPSFTRESDKVLYEKLGLL